MRSIFSVFFCAFSGAASVSAQTEALGAIVEQQSTVHAAVMAVENAIIPQSNPATPRIDCEGMRLADISAGLEQLLAGHSKDREVVIAAIGNEKRLSSEFSLADLSRQCSRTEQREIERMLSEIPATPFAQETSLGMRLMICSDDIKRRVETSMAEEGDFARRARLARIEQEAFELRQRTTDIATKYEDYALKLRRVRDSLELIDTTFCDGDPEFSDF